MSVFIHDTSCVDKGAKIGDGTHIWHFCHIRESAVIGSGCNIGQNVYIDANVAIGNNCKIQNNVSIYQYVILEDDVFCGPSAVFTNVRNPRANLKKMDQALSTIVKKGATLGANSTIICGVTIGEYAFIGAGSVVSKDVQPYALVYGNPARQHGWVCKCGEKLDSNNRCQACSWEMIE